MGQRGLDEQACDSSRDAGLHNDGIVFIKSHRADSGKTVRQCGAFNFGQADSKILLNICIDRDACG